MWSPGDRFHKAIIIFCVGLLVFDLVNLVLSMIGRILNILIPHQLGVVTDELTRETGPDHAFPRKVKRAWISLGVYVFLRFMQGGSGLVELIRSHAWLAFAQVFLCIP
jgi:ATP-binding cassette, subfamily B, vacuolar membrane transporter HMT1/ACLQ